MSTPTGTSISLPTDQAFFADRAFPFHSVLDLMPIIVKWRERTSEKDSMITMEKKEELENTLRAFPFLGQPIKDISVLKPHQEFLEILFSDMVPSANLKMVLMAVAPPFSPFPAAYATKEYHDAFNVQRGSIKMEKGTYSGKTVDYRVLYAYKFILKQFYQYDLNVDQPIMTSKTDPVTGLTRYFKLLGAIQFMKVTSLGPLPELSPAQLQELLENNFDEDRWFEVLPPQNFLFSGTVVLTLVDVTTEESIARIQFHLLSHAEKDQQVLFDKLRQEVQNLFRLPGLRLGIATIQRNGQLNFKSANPFWNSLLLHEASKEAEQLFPQSVYEEVISKEHLIVLEDLRKPDYVRDPLIQAILKTGYCNLLLTPIYHGDQLIGLLELASPVAGLITGLSLFKINQVKPILGFAQKRLQDDFENKVEAIMMQQFTSIHPSISWRFREAAIEYLDTRSGTWSGHDITFENVYPFYGSLDIRDSSKKRNKAIERDIAFNLQKAREVLGHGFEKLSFDILGELIHEIEAYQKDLECSFTSGDESKLVTFIRQDVNPVILHLHNDYPDIRHVTQSYVNCTENGSSAFTLHRLGYETALAKVNQCIVQHLESEEQALQKLYPCYFEKFRTDGVEYNIYAGSSIARGRHLDPLYLDNLRLRQLMWTCRIVRDVKAMEPELYTLMHHAIDTSSYVESNSPAECIDVAPLIMAYGNPISIRFKQEEKRLDVDGSYSMRYEIMKKRIDKSVIQGTSERLTQPGHIAIIYTNDQEIAMYQKHLPYLAKKELIEEGWEALLLEPMQGVEGLKALRIKVKAGGPK